MKAENIPNNLTKESRKIWRDINHDWELETDQLIVLKTALEAYDRLQMARDAIDETSVLIKTPTGHIKANPALRIEKDARAGFLQAWRMLNLNIEPPGEIGRPPTG